MIEVRNVHACRFGWQAVVAVLAVMLSCAAVAAGERPNILWFVVDDMSAHFSCYGEDQIQTPHVDRLAREGVRYTHAHVTAPVCSTCRSAFITGMYQTSLGAHNHRMTGPPIRLPDTVEPLPTLFRRAGYYTCNGDGLLRPTGKVRNKIDYNFTYDVDLYDAKDWSGRAPGQPFFMQIQLAGGKLRGRDRSSFESILQRAQEMFGEAVDAEQVKLPPYYPDDELLRLDWAAYLASVQLTDDHVGRILERLEQEAILDQTLIVFMTDHGISHARGKQFNYREGTHIPFVVRGPGIDPSVNAEFVEHIDMAAISLAAAGIPIPESMQARNILSDDHRRRDTVFAARDRCDETIDMIRSVRSQEFLYIRNYQPFRPYLQPSRYKDNKDLLKRLRELRNEGRLNALQMRLLFADRRAGEELYDLKNDPFETRNVVEDPDFTRQRETLRQQLDRHLISTRDAGFLPEPLIAEIAGGPQTIYDYCRSDETYPIRYIVEVASLAIAADADQLPRLRQELRHDNRIVRYWAAVGLRILGGEATPAESDLRTALSDTDASVRITVAATLAELGQRDAMVSFLLHEAASAQDDAHALWALDAIKFLDVPDVVQRYSQDELVHGEYSGRTVDFLLKGGEVFGSGTDYWNP